VIESNCEFEEVATIHNMIWQSEWVQVYVNGVYGSLAPKLAYEAARKSAHMAFILYPELRG
jgi:hypothetical protein